MIARQHAERDRFSSNMFAEAIQVIAENKKVEVKLYNLLYIINMGALKPYTLPNLFFENDNNE